MGNTPKIRFKGFTDDWEQRKLGDIITEYKETVDSDCTLPILTSSKTEGVILQEEHFGRKQQHDITGYNILPRNYCTYRNRSDGVDFTFNINKCCDKGIISKFYPVFSGKNSDVFFLSLVLNNSEEVVREIAYTCTGTGQKVLSFLDLQKMKVRVPNFDEQKEIAAYFESLDHLITLHQRKCDETKKLKKYMLQKMFPQKNEKKPEIRFAGFTDDWEQRKLGELAEIVGGGTPSTSVNSYWDGDIDWYAPAEIGEQIYLESSQRKITEEGLNKSSAKILPIGTVLFTSRAGIGKTAILLKEGCTNQGFQSIVPNKVKLDSYFIFTRSEELKRYGETVGAGSTFVEVSGKQMANMELMMPKTMPEQQQIGEYFANLDHLITLHQRKCDEIKEVKKFMLQNMFPQKG